MASVADIKTGSDVPVRIINWVTARANWLPYALLGLGFLIVRPSVFLIADVSWLITVCEHVLDGQRLYVDIIETNPPAAIWLYMPAVMLARGIGVAPEIVVNVQFLALAVMSAGLSGRILDRAHLLEASHRASLTCAVIAILALLPQFAFGEREHAGVLFLLPLLCALAARAVSCSPTVTQQVVVGVLGGFAICSKPHLALVAGFAVLGALSHTRTVRLLWSLELWVCAAVTIAYGASVFVLAPDFITSILPMVQLTYLQAQLPLILMVLSGGTLVWAWCMYSIAHDLRANPLCLVLAAASAGGAIAFVIQGKGWPYQGLPMVVYALLAQVYLLTRQGPHDRVKLAIAVAVAVLGSSIWLAFPQTSPALREAVAKLHPHPKITVLTNDIAVGHPLVRQVGGTWVGRMCANLYMTAAIWRLQTQTLDDATKAKLDAAIQFEVNMLVEDIARNKPDIVLLGYDRFGLITWIDKTPALKEAMSHYELHGHYDGVDLMKRRPE